MFKYLIFLLFIIGCDSFPNKIDSDSDVLKEDVPVVKPNYCCMNHPRKRLNDIFMSNYDCSQLSQFEKDRCNSVFGGRVCLWNRCKPSLNICSRKIKYEIHYLSLPCWGFKSGFLHEPNRVCPPRNNLDFMPARELSAKW